MVFDYKEKSSKSKHQKNFDNKMMQDQDDSYDNKPMDQALGSKKDKQKFDKKIEELAKRIKAIKDDVIFLNKSLNVRNSQLVKDIA